MRKIKKQWFALLILLSVFIPSLVFADAIPGEMIVTLGENLSEEQKQSVLNEMNVVEEDIEIIYVTNAEEHKYLGNYISKSQIGTKALSSTMITLTEPGTGINVEANNITWVSEGMYANALITAGVKDADVYVTAPIHVSGTAALTGLIKAYEITSEIEIPEEQKQIANEEMVETAELGDKFGIEDATELMTRIKEEIAETPVETEEDLRALIQRVAEQMGITLTEEELNGLVSLFNRMKDLDIDWDQVQNQISNIRNNLDEFLNREDTQSFIATFLDFINQIIDSIKEWFK